MLTIWVMGLRTSASPITLPAPVTTFTTPGGTPASSTILASARAVSGVSSCGLRTMELPAMMAGATFLAKSAAG
jgi:hypothetical protein